MKKLDKKNILVIGDIMLDTYFTGEIKRISPEAPVPVFHKIDERSVPGGAANVAVNLVSAGQNVSIISIIGKDERGKKLIELINDQAIHIEYIFASERKTTEKVRFLANNHQQVIRLDEEDTFELTEAEKVIILEKLREVIKETDLIILSDYLKGLLTYSVTQEIIKIAKEYHIPVIADVKGVEAEKYKGVTLIKPNKKELHDLTGWKVSTREDVIAASEQLRLKCEAKYVLTTLGAEGMILVGDGESYVLPSIKQEVFDVTGAGDTAISYLAACIASGYTIREAVYIANIAAGIQVSKIGTSSVSWLEIQDKISVLDGSHQKIINNEDAKEYRSKDKDKRVVFTNGCFDILHIGHVRYLKKAKELGDLLIIGLNSDQSVKRLKGNDRPINQEADRAEMLAAFDFVDHVIIFDDDTPLELIKMIQPDILVKGGDYKNEYVIGTHEVEERGGKLILLPFVEGKSTSSIIEKINEKSNKGKQ